METLPWVAARDHGPLGKRSVAQFTASRPAKRADFAYRVRREVIEVHVELFLIHFQVIDYLRLARRSQSQSCQDLCLAPRE